MHHPRWMQHLALSCFPPNLFSPLAVGYIKAAPGCFIFDLQSASKLSPGLFDPAGPFSLIVLGSPPTVVQFEHLEVSDISRRLAEIRPKLDAWRVTITTVIVVHPACFCGPELPEQTVIAPWELQLWFAGLL